MAYRSGSGRAGCGTPQGEKALPQGEGCPGGTGTGTGGSPYADSEFSWLTDEPAEGAEPADAASEEPEKAQTMNMQTEETQTPEETKEEQQS